MNGADAGVFGIVVAGINVVIQTAPGSKNSTRLGQHSRDDGPGDMLQDIGADDVIDGLIRQSGRASVAWHMIFDSAGPQDSDHIFGVVRERSFGQQEALAEDLRGKEATRSDPIQFLVDPFDRESQSSRRQPGIEIERNHLAGTRQVAQERKNRMPTRADFENNFFLQGEAIFPHPFEQSQFAVELIAERS